MSRSFTGQFLVGACIAIACAAAQAQTWQLTTSDFQTRQVELHSIDDNGAGVAAPGAQPATIGFDRLLQLERPLDEQPPAGAFVLQLIGGDRVVGEPVAIEGEQVRWRNPSLGEMSLPLQRVAVLHRQGQPVDVAASRPQDVITLSNGDIVAGIVSDITPQQITVQSDGQPVAVPLETLAHAAFATTAAAPPPLGRGLRVTLVDGSAVTGSQIHLREKSLEVALSPDDRRAVPLEQVRRIEQINGPVVWLSSLSPSENVHVPYFTQLSLPARFDQTIDGEPIRFSGRTFARGIGVHSYSRLSWTLDASYKSFRTQYAIDGDLPYADVTVRVKLGDRVVHEQKNVKAAELSKVVNIELGGAATLTLEVDYGEGYDVQDRLNWIQPALLR